MNREIRFRVWDKLSKKFIDLGVGGLRGDYSFDDYLDDTFNDPISKFVAQQYTGLKDQNGTDIFEGDIVTYGLPIGHPDKRKEFKEEIKWENHGWVLLGRVKDGTYANPMYSWPGMVVIGNIFENPELIKQEK